MLSFTKARQLSRPQQRTLRAGPSCGTDDGWRRFIIPAYYFALSAGPYVKELPPRLSGKEKRLVYMIRLMKTALNVSTFSAGMHFYPLRFAAEPKPIMFRVITTARKQEKNGLKAVPGFRFTWTDLSNTKI